MRYSKLLVAALSALILASCGTPKSIPYFQDASDTTSYSAPSRGIVTLKPGDKISIVVKSRDVNLTSLFNLPFITQRIGSAVEAYTGYTTGVVGYLVTDNGTISFPVLGDVMAAGKTRSELASYLSETLISRNLVKDPVVQVDFMNLTVGVMGEVNKPGSYSITKDSFTVLDALSMAGDLTIFGQRECVKVVREIDGKTSTYTINLCSLEQMVASPAYYLQQNDVVYVEPNQVRARQSTVNGNNVLSTSFWISIASLATTVFLAMNQLGFLK